MYSGSVSRRVRTSIPPARPRSTRAIGTPKTSHRRNVRGSAAICWESRARRSKAFAGEPTREAIPPMFAAYIIPSVRVIRYPETSYCCVGKSLAEGFGASDGTSGIIRRTVMKFGMNIDRNKVPVIVAASVRRLVLA